MDNKIQTTAININLWIHHFNFCATPSQYWLFYQWQHTTLWVLYWALLLREYTVRKYLKYENLYTVKYCSTVFVLLNTVKDFVNKVLSTPLIYICSTVYKMAKILTKKRFIAVIFPHFPHSKKSKWQAAICRKKGQISNKKVHKSKWKACKYWIFKDCRGPRDDQASIHACFQLQSIDLFYRLRTTWFVVHREFTQVLMIFRIVRAVSVGCY